MNRRRRGKPAGPPRIAGDVDDPLALGALLLSHLDALVVLGRSERTVRARRFNMNLFIDFCAERDIHHARDVDRSVVDRYQRHVFLHKTKEGASLAFRSQCELLVAVKTFFRWAAEDQRLLVDPASSMRLPQRERRLPGTVLTHAEAEAVLNVPDVTTSKGIRDRAILEVFYSTAIRRNELKQLTVDGIDHARGTLFVRSGKGRRDRVVPIGERALAWVKKYVDEVRGFFVLDANELTLFVTLDGGPFSSNGLGQMVKKCIDGSGVGKKGSCHLFRHTAATLMLEGGADIRFIQALLGHENLSTTEIYTRVAIKKLQEVHAATHPSAKLDHAPAESEEP